jgi:antitoxin HicB
VAKAQNKHLGSSFDDFLAEEGIYEEVTAVAWKRVLAWEVSEAMRKEGISKSEMAKRMKTSRSQLERFLDPDNPSVLLETVQKAAAAIGKRVTIGLIDARELRPSVKVPAHLLRSFEFMAERVNEDRDSFVLPER